jgi:hypothetical protein
VPTYDSFEEEAGRVYSTTANPDNRQNVDLYRNRFRPADGGTDPATAVACVSRQQQFRDMYTGTDWPEQHRHLLRGNFLCLRASLF